MLILRNNMKLGKHGVLTNSSLICDYDLKPSSGGLYYMLFFGNRSGGILIVLSNAPTIKYPNINLPYLYHIP